MHPVPARERRDKRSKKEADSRPEYREASIVVDFEGCWLRVVNKGIEGRTSMSSKPNHDV